MKSGLSGPCSVHALCLSLSLSLSLTPPSPAPCRSGSRAAEGAHAAPRRRLLPLSEQGPPPDPRSRSAAPPPPGRAETAPPPAAKRCEVLRRVGSRKACVACGCISRRGALTNREAAFGAPSYLHAAHVYARPQNHKTLQRPQESHAAHVRLTWLRPAGAAPRTRAASGRDRRPSHEELPRHGPPTAGRTSCARTVRPSRGPTAPSSPAATAATPASPQFDRRQRRQCRASATGRPPAGSARRVRRVRRRAHLGLVREGRRGALGPGAVAGNVERKGDVDACR